MAKKDLVKKAKDVETPEAKVSKRIVRGRCVRHPKSEHYGMITDERLGHLTALVMVGPQRGKLVGFSDQQASEFTIAREIDGERLITDFLALPEKTVREWAGDKWDKFAKAASKDGSFDDKCFALGDAMWGFHGMRRHEGQGKFYSAVQAAKKNTPKVKLPETKVQEELSQSE